MVCIRTETVPSCAAVCPCACFSPCSPLSWRCVQGTGRGNGPVRVAHGSEESWEHLRARAPHGNEGLQAAAGSLPWPNLGCEVLWKGGGGTMTGYLGCEREGGRRCPRCTACRDLRGPTAWTRRGYFWRGFKCLDAPSNPEGERGRGVHQYLPCFQIPITGQTPWLLHTLWFIVRRCATQVRFLAASCQHSSISVDRGVSLRRWLNAHWENVTFPSMFPDLSPHPQSVTTSLLVMLMSNPHQKAGALTKVGGLLNWP